MSLHKKYGGMKRWDGQGVIAGNVINFSRAMAKWPTLLTHFSPPRRTYAEVFSFLLRPFTSRREGSCLFQRDARLRLDLSAPELWTLPGTRS